MLTPWKKTLDNLDSILKSRDITLPTKVHLVKAMVFPVVMYGCESWTIKKAEHWRTDALELWCWRRVLRVSWTARRSNQSIQKEISTEYSLEGLMLRLKLQYFGHLMRRANSLEKTLILGKIEGRRRREGQRRRWLDGITDSMTWVWASSRSRCWTGRPGVLQPMGSQRVGYTEWLNNNCVHAHPRGGPWDKLTKRGQSKMIGLREDKDTENCPFIIKYLNFPKVGLSLSLSLPAMGLSTHTFLFNNLFTLPFTLCLLAWICSWLGRQRLGTLALTAGPCGPAVRTPRLGSWDTVSSYRSLLLAANCCLLLHPSEISSGFL